MTNTHITKEEIMVVYPKTAEIIAAALPCEIERVKPEASLIDDLGAQSIDFLDIVFRLERAFKVKIPRGKIFEGHEAPSPKPNSSTRARCQRPDWNA
jgi:acyl carrier protein